MRWMFIYMRNSNFYYSKGTELHHLLSMCGHEILLVSRKTNSGLGANQGSWCSAQPGSSWGLGWVHMSKHCPQNSVTRMSHCCKQSLGWCLPTPGCPGSQESNCTKDWTLISTTKYVYLEMYKLQAWLGTFYSTFWTTLKLSWSLTKKQWLSKACCLFWWIFSFI